jgi:hypothetical protein
MGFLQTLVVHCEEFSQGYVLSVASHQKQGLTYFLNVRQYGIDGLKQLGCCKLQKCRLEEWFLLLT